MKKSISIFNEKGQGLVEYTLILAFCASLYMGANYEDFKQSIRTIYDNVVAVNVTKVYGLGDVYVMALDAWGKKTRSELAEVPDAHRLNADQQALVNIGKVFIGKSLTPSDVKALIKPGDNSYNDNYLLDGKEVVIFNYLDDSSKDISTGYKGDSRAPQTIHWMQGDYGTQNPDGSYSYTTDGFDNTTRFFYSDCMMKDKSQVDWGNDQWGNDRTIRVSFTFKDEDGKKVVDSVRVRVNRGDQNKANSHYHELDIKITEDYEGQYTPGATGVY